VLALLSPVWGAIADRFGRRMMALRVTLSGAVTIGLMAFAQNVYQLAVLRLAQGAFTGFVAAASALATAMVPRQRLAYALGVMQMALFAGTAIGPLTGGIAADLFGFRLSFVAAAVLMLAATLIIFFFVQEQFQPPQKDAAGPGGVKGMLMSIRQTGRDRSLLAMLLVLFSVQFGVNTAQPILALFVQEIDPSAQVASVTGLIFTVTGAVAAITSLNLGRMTDRFGYRKPLIVLALGAAVMYIPQFFVTHVAQLVVLRGVLGLFDGAMLPTANALIATRGSVQSRGTTYGLIYMSTGLGFAIGPLAGGFIAATLGLRAVFLVTALILLAVGIYLPFSVPEEPTLVVLSDAT
jgi:DHA1 family multidrug resistance protein-like MFS transporter